MKSCKYNQQGKPSNILQRGVVIGDEDGDGLYRGLLEGRGERGRPGRNSLGSSFTLLTLTFSPRDAAMVEALVFFELGAAVVSVSRLSSVGSAPLSSCTDGSSSPPESSVGAVLGVRSSWDARHGPHR